MTKPCIVVNGATYCYEHLYVQCAVCNLDFKKDNEREEQTRRNQLQSQSQSSQSQSSERSSIGDAILNTISRQVYTGSPGQLVANYASYCAYRNCPDPSGKSSNRKLGLCSKCRKIKYCSRECQQQDWSTEHKRSCIPPAGDFTELGLTWADIREDPNLTTDPQKYLEIYITRDASLVRQIMIGKDRKGESNMVAIYTSEGRIKNLKINTMVRLKHAEFRVFLDGVNRGVKIQDEDLENMEIIPMRLKSN